MPVNVSGHVATAVACNIQSRRADDTISLLHLPTEWSAARTLWREAIERDKPQVAIAFGVSGRARSLFIETVARNRAIGLDAAHCLPEQTTLTPDGRAVLSVRYPSRRLIKVLRANGYPVTRSVSAGSYLCNAILYDALSAGEDRSGRPLACFMHMPAYMTPTYRTPAGRTSSHVNKARIAPDPATPTSDPERAATDHVQATATPDDLTRVVKAGTLAADWLAAMAAEAR